MNRNSSFVEKECFLGNRKESDRIAGRVGGRHRAPGEQGVPLARATQDARMAPTLTNSLEIVFGFSSWDGRNNRGAGHHCNKRKRNQNVVHQEDSFSKFKHPEPDRSDVIAFCIARNTFGIGLGNFVLLLCNNRSEIVHR